MPLLSSSAGPGWLMRAPIAAGPKLPSTRQRTLLALAALIACFVAIAAQLLRLGLKAEADFHLNIAEPIGQSWSRPDIVDRHGQLLATDVATHSLYADPQLVLDIDEVAEKLTAALAGLDGTEVRRALADRGRRFAWIARGLTPRQAQRVHDLGLPGLAFRTELKRVYPLGALAGHVVGTVNVDNKGLVGLERWLDDMGKVEAVQGTDRSEKPALRLSLDVGVQHAVSEELHAAVARYSATGAAGLVLDLTSGEVLAAASLPGADPARPSDWLELRHADKLMSGTFELGSVFKTLTVAMALEAGVADLNSLYDVRRPLTIGANTITDLHPSGRPLSVREVFLHSSNVGAGLIALDLGAERQRQFLAKFGLIEPMRTEAGSIAPPQLPKHWGRIETVTVSYGHGIAVAPLQLAAAMAGVIGGIKVTPTFLAQASPPGTRLVSQATSAHIQEILRLNVTSAVGTGRRADAEGYRVGGKTGTAEMPGRGGYQAKAVISSFIGAFPMDAPNYLTLVMLFEPEPVAGIAPGITAGVNAAPTTARIVHRIAPVLGVLPRRIGRAEPTDAQFDAPSAAQ
ncbi:MAG TPA: penicillin-binding protein 2 [Hyphomicrobiaceae bacterium]|nr:penicillin-binding protein 2 [Hyphomicrobiaceae bacterium]